CVAAVPDHLRLDTAAFLVPCLVSSRGVRARRRADASSHARGAPHAAQHSDLHDHPGGNLPRAVRIGHERVDLSVVRALLKRGFRCLCDQALRSLQRSTGTANVSLFDHVPLPHVCCAARRSLLPLGVGEMPLVEASDIQATVLRPRPSSYRGEYVILRIDQAEQGQEMLRRILPHVAPADEWWVPSLPGWLGIAFTFEGLKALGVPQASLDSFPIEFKQGMAA